MFAVMFQHRWNTMNQETDATRAPDLRLEQEDRGPTLPAIVQKDATARAESSLTSARVLAEDSLLYMNRDPAVLTRPEDLAAKRGVSLFRRSALQSLGDYVNANYHPDGVLGFFRETFLNDSFDKRIVSPLSPVTAGNPGTSYAAKNYVHVGVRNLLSTNPRSFITLNDKVELDAAVNGPSFVLRDPIYLGGSRAVVPALALEYPDWKVNGWMPRVGATIAYVHGNHSINLTASAGRGDFELNPGEVESRYEERIMMFAQFAF